MVQINTLIAAAAVLSVASLSEAAPFGPGGSGGPVDRFGPAAKGPAAIQQALHNLSFNNNPWAYSCKAPWKPASKPSFTFGCSASTVPYWNGGDKAACKWPWFSWTSFCRRGNPSKPLPPNCDPPKTPEQGPVCEQGYQQVFTEYTTNATSGVYQGTVVGAATIDNENYLTYILSTSVDGCLTMCDQTSGCAFVNVYQDNADNASDIDELPASAQAKYQAGQLTCALYKACSGTDKATNYGGQQDPTYITHSAGYCKGANCATTPSRK